MNISRPNKYKKSRAQAMVEFALALPILLTLLYGLLETGRLLFIYASTVTAARQAARYGSATGDGPNGLPYYQDCDGIVGAANRVGFINIFESVDISYDDGLDDNGLVLHLGDSSPDAKTPDDPDCGEYTEAANGDRVVVEVSALWQPIVPIVPLDPFTITSQSERTILASVSISVTAVPQGWQNSGTGALALLSVEGSPDPYSTVGQTITYIYTLENIGTGDLAGPFDIGGNITSEDCSGVTDPLPPGIPATCTGTYQITQADLDAGTVTNVGSATANGSPSIPATVTEIIYSANGLDSLSLSKSASPISATVVGTNITYTYTLTNTGSVTLTSPYSVDDNKIPGGADCSGAASPLAPSASTTCTATYSIKNSDINNGSVVNQAVGTAYYPYQDKTVTSNTASATVYTTPLVLVITPSPATVTLPNQVITYSYAVSNGSGAAVNSLSITDSKVTTVTCPSTTIPAGGSITCSGPYTVTQTDFDTGGTIVNTATATGNNGAAVSSNTATASVAITQTPALSAVVSASPSQPVSPATTIPAGTSIAYTYTLTNTGNVTLSSTFSVSDNKITINCSNQTSLPPGGTKTCTGTYTVTAADVNAGSIVNTGTASAAFGAQTVTSAPASATVITYADARFSLALSADPTTVTQAGTSVVFTYTITNTGGTSLTSPYSITSSLLGSFNCGGTSPLAPGASTSCQNSYAASSEITNTITAATAMNGGSPVDSSNLPSITVPYNVCSSGNLSLGSPVYTDNTVTWTITNDIGTLNINTITVDWNTAGNRYLGEVQLPSGTTIWTGSDKDGSASFPNPSSTSAPWTITGNTNLVMIFTKTGITVTDMNLTFVEAGCGPLNNP